MVQQEVLSLNCDACGSEELETDLKTVKISSFSRPITICNSCFSITPEESLKRAAQILLEINSLSEKKDNDPEQRLKMIMKILGGNQLF
jgi:uncharacterized Zn finger protein